jgi:hypothetical protein
MADTPLLQADDTHSHEAQCHLTPLLQASDTNIHEALRHGALAVDQSPYHGQPSYQEPLPFKAPPPGYNLDRPPPKWGAPHQSARQPPPIVFLYTEQSFEQMHQHFLRSQRLRLAHLLDARTGTRMGDRTPPLKAPPKKAPPFGKAPPPPKHNGSNRWTNYTYLPMHADPPPAASSASSSDTDNTYNLMPGLVDDPYRMRSRSPSTISRGSTRIPSSTSAGSVASRTDCPRTPE